MKILIIEDEKILAQSIKTLLSANGYETETAFDGMTGFEYAALKTYDLIITDIALPKLSGYELTRELRQNHCTTPILMLATTCTMEDRIQSLSSGIDYYLIKPFDPRELLASIQALLRRQGTQQNELSYGNTRLDLASATLGCGENTVRLSAKEFDVMRLLLQAPERNLSKECILSHVWGYESNAVENHVEVYIGFLRKKLKSIQSNVKITAIRRLGYHLEAE